LKTRLAAAQGAWEQEIKNSVRSGIHAGAASFIKAATHKRFPFGGNKYTSVNKNPAINLSETCEVSRAFSEKNFSSGAKKGEKVVDLLPDCALLSFGYAAIAWTGPTQFSRTIHVFAQGRHKRISLSFNAPKREGALLELTNLC